MDPAPREARQIRTLIVEDDQDQAELVGEQLAALGWGRFDTSIASSLQDALGKLSKEHFQLLLADLNLPDSGGLETVRRLKPAARDATVVALTGLSDGDLAADAIKLGVEEYVVKGTDLDGFDRALRSALERAKLRRDFREVVERNADAMVIVDRAGRVLYVNPSAEELFGKPAAVLIGEPFELPHPKHDVLEIEILRHGHPRTGELRSTDVEWEGEPSRLFTIRDVTDRRRAEELEMRLLESERLASLGQLAAGVAHEINTPAAFVTANLTMLHERFDALTDMLQGSRLPLGADLSEILRDSEEMLRDCDVGIRRITSITQDLRSFSRIDREDVELVDINDVVRVACKMVATEIRHRAQLVTRLGEVREIAAHRGKLSQVLINLLMNAAHAVDEARPEQNRIEITTEQIGGRLVITVSDTGRGIPEDEIQHVFEPFYTTKPRGIGTGLGLALCAETVRKHGGQIEVVSEVGKGTRFEITLPLDTGLQPRRPVSRRLVRGAKSRARVLLIDDDTMLRRAYTRMLARYHDVEGAESGRAALDLLRCGGDFDVILCDLMMPGLDGPGVYEALEKEHPELLDRFIFVSGGAFTSRVNAFLRRVRPQLLEKPVNRQTLLGAIDRSIERRS